MFGYGPGGLVGVHASVVSAPSGKPPEQAVAEIAKGLEEMGEWHGEVCNRRKDGTIFWCNANVSTFEHPEFGTVWVSLHTDTTQHKAAEDALAAERERLAVTLACIGDGVIATGMDGRVVLLNKVAQKLTGWLQEEALGRRLEEVFRIVHEGSREMCENPVDKVLRTRGVIGLANHTLLIARDGTERVLADSGAPIRDQQSRIIGVVLVFRDVTRERAMEAKLFRAQKLESVGVLAGGIAHDFNNILTAVLGNISIGKLRSDSPAVMSRLEEAEKAVERATGLSHQLLTFAKGGGPVLKRTALVPLVRESAGFALRGSTTMASFSIPDDVWDVEADAGQIGQVVGNLILNAGQAMPKGGTVHVAVQDLEVGEQDVRGLPKGRFVEIAVADTGIGIRPEHLVRIFDPYFTTRQMGSGIGLTTSHSIVKNHGGAIVVESRIGQGSTFRVYLPAFGGKAVAPPDVSAEIIRGTGRILVMDDDEDIRELLMALLTNFGYDVAAAANGTEAVRLYVEAQEVRRPFAMVLLDITVPGGMGGVETYERLRSMDPQVTGIVSSGYSNDPVMADFRSYGFKAALPKPYRAEELSAVLRQVLEQPMVPATPRC